MEGLITYFLADRKRRVLFSSDSLFCLRATSVKAQPLASLGTTGCGTYKSKSHQHLVATHVVALHFLKQKDSSREEADKMVTSHGDGRGNEGSGTPISSIAK